VYAEILQYNGDTIRQPFDGAVIIIDDKNIKEIRMDNVYQVFNIVNASHSIKGDYGSFVVMRDGDDGGKLDLAYKFRGDSLVLIDAQNYAEIICVRN
jgi:hypothetical protein